MTDKHPTEEQFEKAYQKALSELQPSELVEHSILSKARAQTRHGNDWAVFPVWARVASVAGIATLGWWLWSPPAHEPELSALAPEQIVVPLAEVAEAVPLKVESKRSANMAQQTIQAERAIENVRGSVSDDLGKFKSQRETDGLVKQKSAPTAKAMKFSNSMDHTRLCFKAHLQTIVEQSTITGLPAQVTKSLVINSPMVTWQKQKWYLVAMTDKAFLVRQEEQVWLHVKIPDQLTTRCNQK